MYLKIKIGAPFDPLLSSVYSIVVVLILAQFTQIDLTSSVSLCYKWGYPILGLTLLKISELFDLGQINLIDCLWLAWKWNFSLDQDGCDCTQSKISQAFYWLIKNIGILEDFIFYFIVSLLLLFHCVYWWSVNIGLESSQVHDRCHVIVKSNYNWLQYTWMHHLAPVPLTIFRSNSKFDQNWERSSLKYDQPITTKFCTRHDSYTVVTCAKFLCDV